MFFSMTSQIVSNIEKKKLRHFDPRRNLGVELSCPKGLSSLAWALSEILWKSEIYPSINFLYRMHGLGAHRVWEDGGGTTVSAIWQCGLLLEVLECECEHCNQVLLQRNLSQSTQNWVVSNLWCVSIIQVSIFHLSNSRIVY